MGKGGTFHFRQVKELKKQLDQLQREQESFAKDCIRELAARLLRNVVKRTPKGTPPTLAKGSVRVKVKGKDGKTRIRSFLSKEGAIYQTYWAHYRGGTLQRNWTVGEIQKASDGYVIEIINPTDYASYVEYGHRQKPGRYVGALGKRLKKAWAPGRFMLTISEKELERAAPGILKKKLDEHLKRYFHV